ASVVPAAGAVILTAGAVLSRLKVRLSEPVLPATSVCDATTVFIPSPDEKLILAFHNPAVQLTEVEALTPAPERVTSKPFSQAPDTVNPLESVMPAAGETIVTIGATESLTKLRLSEAEF